jgi:hypothetical protein
MGIAFCYYMKIKRSLMPTNLACILSRCLSFVLRAKNLLLTGLLWTLASANVHAATDPRLEIDDVRKCVDTAKEFLRSSEYGEVEKEHNRL